MATRHSTVVPPQVKLGLEDLFYCRARRRRLTLEKCLDDYVDANAFSTRRVVCWRCPQGRQNREDYANT